MQFIAIGLPPTKSFISHGSRLTAAVVVVALNAVGAYSFLHNLACLKVLLSSCLAPSGMTDLSGLRYLA